MKKLIPRASIPLHRGGRSRTERQAGSRPQFFYGFTHRLAFRERTDALLRSSAAPHGRHARGGARRKSRARRPERLRQDQLAQDSRRRERGGLRRNLAAARTAGGLSAAGV